jgi:Zn-dependent M28 family amino/carboxypeptidase
MYEHAANNWNSPPDKSIGQHIAPIRKENVKGARKRTLSIADESINSVVSSISRNNIEKWITELASFHTRHTKSKYINEIANWLKSKLEHISQININFHHYEEGGYNLKNVICEKAGSSSDQVILVCAHYDSRVEDLEDKNSRAPGADDNASGVAVLLEVARLISILNLGKSIFLAFFSGEEQGLWGSAHYAKQIKHDNVNLYRLINLDMVGYPPRNGKTTVTVERDIGNKVTTNDKDSQAFANKMEQMALDYTDLDVVLGPIYDSDYMPFEALGYVTIGCYDGGATIENTHYHSVTDDICFVNMDYVVSVAKMVLASVLKEAAILPTKS